MSYLKRWRLQLAARLLQNQALSLSSIAEQVGYESAAAFSRVFKREFGVAPGQYRRNGGISEGTSGAGMHKAIPVSSRVGAREVRQVKEVSSAAS
jgi:AraC-like DNA-binding protein